MLSPDWLVSPPEILTPYPEALSFMESRVEAISGGKAAPLVWLLQHPPLYTGGTSADAADVYNPQQYPVYADTGRGGQYTYHGPGQIIGYVMLDLKAYRPDVRWYVGRLEEWLIQTLAVLGVTGERRAGRVGVWVVCPDGVERKIAALGVRVKRWVTLHGVSLNVSPDLNAFDGIVPCGLKDYGVTSLNALGIKTDTKAVMQIMQQQFPAVFAEKTLLPPLA
ncbi:MAG: lipoyl(octanoyl) transferase LipB [Alphaproteobacteria bacterium]|jgi:lipoyl(octanoyl) transferase|nr:lipoyl(octanoyl) transferase LipB [Thalassospira sp.]MCE2964784.1 lipoyl(octanoyl) transferase LipB [Alphaproteobacteria bacterium]